MNYPSNQECLYKIKNPKGGALSLNFIDFDVHQTDFVQVSNFINSDYINSFTERIFIRLTINFCNTLRFTMDQV